jgi:hypothetical protein
LSWDPASPSPTLTRVPLITTQGSTPSAQHVEQPIRTLPRLELETSPVNIRATLPFGPSLPLPGEAVPGVDIQEDELAADPRYAVALSSGMTDASAFASAVPEPAPTALQADAEPSSAATTADEGAPASATPESPPESRTAVSVPTPVEATPAPHSPAVDANPRTTSDAPTTQSWRPQGSPPSALRRFAPLGVALAAVAVAFIGGVQFGKMRPTPAVRGASAGPGAAVRGAAAQAAPPAAGTTMPAGASPTAPAPPETAVLPANAKPARPVTGKFSAKAAHAALGQAMGRVRACKKQGGAGGTALAQVTFGASGRVEDVTVSGARIAGTPAATCVASALSTVRVAPFAGNAQTVKRTIKLY